MRSTRFEQSTAGFDPAFQGIGSDPYGGSSNVGLRVEPFPPPTNTPQTRYLYLLSAIGVNAGERLHIVGLRQMLTIGATVGTGNYILEQQVTTPYWHFSDANVSWHLMRIPPNKLAIENAFNSVDKMHGYGRSPSLLFQKAPSEGGGYKPPYGGRPPGEPLTDSLGCFYDIRFPWVDDHAWDSMDVEVEGPCDIALFASVQQTSPDTRTILDIPDAGCIPCIPCEDTFVAQFDNARYWRVAGSIIFEKVNMIPEDRALVDDSTGEWCDPTNRGQGGANGSQEPPPGGIAPPSGGGNSPVGTPTSGGTTPVRGSSTSAQLPSNKGSGGSTQAQTLGPRGRSGGAPK